MVEKVGDIRRIRVQYHGWHNPPIWAAYLQPPGKISCHCHAPTLEDMWRQLRDYFAGNPLRIEARFERFLK